MWSISNDYYLIDYHSCNRLFKIFLIVIVIVIALANFYDYIPDLDAYNNVILYLSYSLLYNYLYIWQEIFTGPLFLETFWIKIAKNTC